MATEAQILTILTILAPLHLSRVLYKSTLFMQNKPNFQNAQMNVNTVLTKHYEKTGLSDKGKTNPIQTQFKANTNPIPEKPKMNVTSILTKDYENETAFRLRQNKPKTNPKQTQSNPIAKAKKPPIPPPKSGYFQFSIFLSYG